MSLLKFFKHEKKVETKSTEKKDGAVKEGKPEERALAKKLEAPLKASVEKKKNFGGYKNIIKPLVTEKSASLSSMNKYVFVVKASMNKIEIRKAIKDMYGMKPENVRVMNVSGKNVRYGKTKGKTKSWKKAIVSLRQGDKIEVYEGV